MYLSNAKSGQEKGKEKPRGVDTCEWGFCIWTQKNKGMTHKILVVVSLFKTENNKIPNGKNPSVKIAYFF